MLTLEIRFLTGRYAAGRYNRPDQAEWPPHPARVYSALVAALHDDPEPSAHAEHALDWLASVGAPDIVASAAEERRISKVFVPPNDQKALSGIDRELLELDNAERAASMVDQADVGAAEAQLKVALEEVRKKSLETAGSDGRGSPGLAAQLLDRRLSPQPRPFPVAVPHDDFVQLIWTATPDPAVLQELDSIAARVAKLGHSSSLVAMRFQATPEAALPDVAPNDRERWTPDDNGGLVVRTVSQGQLARLRREHDRHLQIETRILPFESTRYRPVRANTELEPCTTAFSDDARDWILFEVVPPNGKSRRNLLDLSLAQLVARSLRSLLVAHLGQETTDAEVISGIDSEGHASRAPHMAFVALGDVRHPLQRFADGATGSILGVALIPPRQMTTEARSLLLRAIHSAEQAIGPLHGSGDDRPLGSPSISLDTGRHGSLYVQRLTGVSSQFTLDPIRWTRPSRRWVSATAVALGRNPGNLHSRDSEEVEQAVAKAEETIAIECANIGLETPEAVWIHRRSLLAGAPAARRFMPFPLAGGGPRRVCVHAELIFNRPVRGPVLVGAGRYLGLGLFAPVPESI